MYLKEGRYVYLFLSYPAATSYVLTIGTPVQANILPTYLLLQSYSTLPANGTVIMKYCIFFYFRDRYARLYS